MYLQQVYTVHGMNEKCKLIMNTEMKFQMELHFFLCTSFNTAWRKLVMVTLTKTLHWDQPHWTIFLSLSFSLTHSLPLFQCLPQTRAPFLKAMEIYGSKLFGKMITYRSRYPMIFCENQFVDKFGIHEFPRCT